MKLSIHNINDVFKSQKMSVDTAELRGYKLIKEYFVDNSGFGSDNEPAMTASYFIKDLTSDLNKLGQCYSFITNVGQFQVYVGLFSKSGKKKSKKIANNTYEIYDNDGDVMAIRLHDTNVVEWDHDYMILNSGGWLTRTTKDRINQNLPNGVNLYQKAGEWFIKDDRDNTVKPFMDEMRIAS